MARLPYEFVCRECLTARGVLDSEALPSCCPACKAADPWVGPVVMPARFARRGARQVVDSPFYLGAVGGSHEHG